MANKVCMFSRFGESPDIAEVYHAVILARCRHERRQSTNCPVLLDEAHQRWLQQARLSSGTCSGDDAYGLRGGGRYKFLNCGNHKLGFIKMNPVLAVFCDYLLDIGADAAQARIR
jgi:hypothetical protein